MSGQVTDRAILPVFGSGRIFGIGGFRVAAAGTAFKSSRERSARQRDRPACMAGHDDVQEKRLIRQQTKNSPSE